MKLILVLKEKLEFTKVRKVHGKYGFTSRTAIGRSEDGGMMGDPFSGVEITKNILIINHSGGSSWKWNDTNKFRFQKGDFYLIGTTNMYGKICESWQEFDFNLSTGNAIFSKQIEVCEDQEQRIGQTFK